jgi:cytoskeleton protein RodZ
VLPAASDAVSTQVVVSGAAATLPVVAADASAAVPSRTLRRPSTAEHDHRAAKAPQLKMSFTADCWLDVRMPTARPCSAV